MNNAYTLARAPSRLQRTWGGQMQGAATEAMPLRIVEERQRRQMPARRRAPGRGPQGCSKVQTLFIDRP